MMKRLKRKNPNGHGPKLMGELGGGCHRYEYYPLGRFVVVAPGVCGGRPTFKGTRVEVQTILDGLRAGRSLEDILKSYPSVSRAAARKAIKLAARALKVHCSLQGRVIVLHENLDEQRVRRPLSARYRGKVLYGSSSGAAPGTPKACRNESS